MSTQTMIGKIRLGEFVDQPFIEMLKKNYKEKRWQYHNKRLGKSDTVQAWYSVNIMQEFIRRAKMLNSDSVRVYFGVYPDNNIAKPEFSGYQTVAIVAQKNDKDVFYTNEMGKEIIMGLNMACICPPFCGTGCQSVKVVPWDEERKEIIHGTFVDQDHIEMLKTTYLEKRHQFNSEMIGKEDELSSAYSLDIFEEFINEIDELKGTSVRFYFGVYPEYFDKNPSLSGKQTVVVVGTQGVKPVVSHGLF